MSKEDVLKVILEEAECVKKKLFESYKGCTAGLLLGTWFKLIVFGEEGTRGLMTRKTFYEHLKLLRDAGVYWDGKYKRMPQISDAMKERRLVVNAGG